VVRPIIIPILVVAASVLALPAFAGQDLVGPVSREDILAHSPAWRDGVAAYAPDPAAIEKLRGLTSETRIEVFLATWCRDSVAHVPAFFKVLDLADTPRLEVSYVALPRAREERAPYCGDRAIERIPTFIVFVGGREAGRIVETPETSVEADLARILGL